MERNRQSVRVILILGWLVTFIRAQKPSVRPSYHFKSSMFV